MITEGFPEPISQKWVEEVLKHPAKYESLFVVHTDEEVVFVSEQLAEADAWLKENQAEFRYNLRLFLVPNNFGQVRLRMLHIKSLSAGEWMPMYQVVFFLQNGSTTTLEMLVDSGADVTFVPYKIGLHLGYEKSFGETALFASGVGSEVPYLLREGKVRIDDTELNIRLLWGQNESVSDILLGRLDVFDHFDVTISQYRQKIFFDPIPKA